MSIRKGNDIIASKPLVDAVPTQDSTNAVSSGGVYTALQGKQDTISDLATIRSGAAAGATAVQPATLDSYVTLATAQTISGVKTFSAELHSTNNITFDSAQATPIIRGMSGANYRNMIVRTNSSSSIDVGNPNDTINLKGSATNPTYNGNNLALYSDLPTVNNPTITLTQGGVTKGLFTLNQASGDTIDFDAGGGYHPDLFDFKWADHELNDVQWLRADTFSWQQGSVYKAAYKHLRNDTYNWYSWENNGTTIYTKKAYPEVGEKVYSDSALTTEVGEITDVTDTLDITVEKITVNSVVYDSVTGSNIAPTTETVGGVTVQYIPAEDGHKIVTDFHESEVADVYTATGVAWYYIIDYGFKRFKLPRTKFGFTGLRDTVGNYVAAGLPNITGSLGDTWYTFGGSRSGAFTAVSGTTHSPTNANNSTGAYTTNFDASASNSIYGNSTTVQPPATQMYLYFYVGEFTQSALENTAGLNAEDFNDKADTDFGNTLMIDYVVAKQEPNAGNGYTWYRKYKSGWVEQGGYNNQGGVAQRSATLPVEMSNGNYQTLFTVIAPNQSGAGSAVSAILGTTTTTGFAFVVRYGTSGVAGEQVFWQVSGIAA